MWLHAAVADLLLSSPPEFKTLQAIAEPECLVQARAPARLREPTRCTVGSLHVSAYQPLLPAPHASPRTLRCRSS